MIMTQMTNSESHPQSFRPLSTEQHRQPSSSQALHERPSRPFRIGCQLPTIDRFLATDRDNEPNTTFPPSDVILNPFLTADDGTGDCRSNKAVTHGSISFGSASRTISFVLGSRSSVIGREKCFVYSAYTDDTNKGGGVVRVIGVAKTNNPDSLWCQFGWPANGTAVIWSAVPAKIEAIS